MCQAIMCGMVLNELTVSFTDKNQSYLTSLAVLNVGNHNTGMVQSFTNITKQVLGEQVLRKSEAHLETLIKTLPDLIWLKDPEGSYLTCNSKFEKFFGESKAEIIGKTDYDFVDKELADFFRENDKTAMASNKPSINEETISYADDGHTEILETIKTPMFDVNGELIGILGVGRDITQRKNSEKQLAESEARFRKLFESTDTISVQGYDKDRKVIYWNYASEKLYGYSEERALGSNIEDLIIPDEMRLQVVDDINNWMQSGPAISSSELTLQNSGGLPVQVYSSHIMFHNHDNEAEMYCVDINLSEYKAAQNALLESELMLDAITNQSIEGISVADTEGNYTFVNDAFCKMTGYSEEELLSLSVFDVKATRQDKSFFDKSKVSKEGHSVRVLLQRKNKITFMSEIIGKSIQIGGIPHVLGVVRDIGSLVEKEQNIRTLSQAVEQAPVSIMITDTDGNIEYVNHAFELTTGYTFEEIKGENPRILKSGNTPVSVYKDLWDAISSGNAWEGEIQNRKKNGELYWEYGHFAPVIDEYGDIRHYLASKEDITLRKQQQEQISHQAHFDILTDLPNRFLALDRLAQLLREAKRYNEQVAVLFLDLDDFKKINDTLGHATGDKLLIEVARRLLSVIRDEDTVGRLGGDEFLILLGRLKKATEAEQIAEAILKRLTESFKIEDRELMVSASIGITVSPDDGDNPAELLRDADAAMYNAKDLGRNTYSFFTDEMNRHLQRRLAIEEQIFGALTRQEFVVFYQPQINMSTGKIMGAEALLRWSNPVLGEVSPSEFIPIAEQTGLIVSIGQFVLTEALNKTALWQNDFDAKFRIAVNLSPAQFRDPKLVEYIENSLQQSGVSSAALELEITEGVLMNGHSYIDSALTGLNNLGVSIAMDDFGIGYSSLSYLRNYPFDVLKIDRSFINDITIDPADRKLIIATIAMAHGLNLKVVAEGVETQEQYDDLKVLGCDYAQGYLIGAPAAADDMSQLLME
ncbi:MAG: PAS domain S-box protein [Methyloprofundus sp.]|nr:PAS domain S-box protein [Methyloprofundus sp.]